MSVSPWIKEDIKEGAHDGNHPQHALARVLLALLNRLWAISRIEPDDLIDDAVWHEQKEDIYVLLEWIRNEEGMEDLTLHARDAVSNWALDMLPRALETTPPAMLSADVLRGILAHEVTQAWNTTNEGARSLVERALMVMQRCYGQSVYGSELVDPDFILNEYHLSDDDPAPWRQIRVVELSNYEFGVAIARQILNSVRSPALQKDPIEGPSWIPYECRLISVALADDLATLIEDGISAELQGERMARDYERRANEIDEAMATTVHIDERLPTISVEHANGDEYFFQGDEAANMLDEVPEWTDPWTYFMVTSQDW